MKSFKHYITEVLDRPLKWKEFTKRPTERQAEFNVGDFGYVIRVMIPARRVVICEVTFWRKS